MYFEPYDSHLLILGNNISEYVEKLIEHTEKI